MFFLWSSRNEYVELCSLIDVRCIWLNLYHRRVSLCFVNVPSWVLCSFIFFQLYDLNAPSWMCWIHCCCILMNCASCKIVHSQCICIFLCFVSLWMYIIRFLLFELWCCLWLMCFVCILTQACRIVVRIFLNSLCWFVSTHYVLWISHNEDAELWCCLADVLCLNANICMQNKMSYIFIW